MKRILVYAHYDKDGVVRRYVESALGALKTEVARVVFVTTAKLPPPEKAKLRGLADRLIEIDNVGYDFFSWRTGILSLADEWADCDELVLMNSSVVGPIFPLANVFDKMRRSDADFWGMTESLEITPHLQSYFLVFRKRLLGDPAFIGYWRELRPLANRQDVIDQYELKLTRHFAARGFKPDSFVKMADLRRCNVRHWLGGFRPDGNPTLLYPEELLKLKMPFVKIQLLRDNPHRIDLAGLRRRVPAERLDYRR